MTGRRRGGVAAAALAAVALGVPAAAQVRTAPPAEGAIRELVDSVLEANPDIPSIAVHLESGKAGWSGTTVAGFADPAARIPLRPEHAFRIASNTKTYVAAAILRLSEMGKLRLDDPIARHLSSGSNQVLIAGGYDPRSITVRHLLSHTSGLYDYAMDTAYFARVMADPAHRWTRPEQLRAAMTMGRPYGRPGEVYHYADTGYILLGEIVERLTGRPLGSALATLLHFRRLGLRSTWLESLEPRPAAVAGRAHQLQGKLDTYRFDPSLDLYGGGGLAATTRDMAVFTRALFTGGVFSRSTTIDTMTSRVPARFATNYRLGIGERSIEGFRSWGHSGYWNTSSQYFPELDLAVAIAIQQNADHQVGRRLLRAVVRRLRPDRAALIDDLQAILDRLVASDSAVPGVAVHLQSPKMGLWWSGAAGVERRGGNPLDPDQPMRIASNTKTYTAAAVLRLAEDRRLSIDDPIGRHLPPEYLAILRRGGYDPEAITLRHLLHHTSGLFDYATDSAYVRAVTGDPGHRWTRLEQVRFAIDHGRPLGPPGTTFHYSDTGYILLGEIVERVSGLPLGAALRSLLGFERHGVHSTWLETVDPDPWIAATRAHQYFGGLDTYGFDPSMDLYGGGGLVAPMKDLATFVRELVRGRIFRRPATIEVMLERPRVPAERDYRMGIYRHRVGTLEGFGHTGFWGTFAFYFPAADLAVAGSITEHVAGSRLMPLLDDLVRAATATR